MKLLILCLLWSGQVLAWGSIGHRVVAQLAEERLSPNAKARLRVILGRDTLADIANWPDAIRSDSRWVMADPWHYVTIEDGQSYNPTTANTKGDVIQAIERFKRELIDAKSTALQKREAVAFLVHFVADVHQPLHVGRGADRGGNSIELKWFRASSNLHQIWDEKLIEMERLSYREYARFIDKASEEQKVAWGRVGLLGWAEESKALRTQVYNFPSTRARNWEYNYRYQMMPIVHERLQQAGVRLAALLNESLRPLPKKVDK